MFLSILDNSIFAHVQIVRSGHIDKGHRAIKCTKQTYQVLDITQRTSNQWIDGRGSDGSKTTMWSEFQEIDLTIQGRGAYQIEHSWDQVYQDGVGSVVERANDNVRLYVLGPLVNLVVIVTHP